MGGSATHLWTSTYIHSVLCSMDTSVLIGVNMMLAVGTLLLFVFVSFLVGAGVWDYIEDKNRENVYKSKGS